MDADTREKLTATLKVDEGKRLQAYCDHTGLIIKPGDWIYSPPSLTPPMFNQDAKRIGSVTIGYGRNLHGKGITDTEAAMLLRADETDVILAMDELLPWSRNLDPVRWIVLANMTFNMGINKIINGWPTFLGCLQRKDFTRAADIMQGAVWALQVGDGPGGKHDRADRLIGMMRTGKMPK